MAPFRGRFHLLLERSPPSGVLDAILGREDGARLGAHTHTRGEQRAMNKKGGQPGRMRCEFRGPHRRSQQSRPITCVVSRQERLYEHTLVCQVRTIGVVERTSGPVDLFHVKSTHALYFRPTVADAPVRKTLANLSFLGPLLPRGSSHVSAGLTLPSFPASSSGSRAHRLGK